MGAAKNRKAEIAQLKANGRTKVQKCLSFGAFYKDDEDCGWSLNFNREELGERNFQFMYDQHVKLVEAELAQLHIGNFDYFDAVDKASAIDSLWEQTKNVIHNFNLDAFGTPVRPNRSTGLKVDLNNRDILREITILMGNIALLTDLGEIKNDEYNGMLFMYE